LCGRAKGDGLDYDLGAVKAECAVSTVRRPDQMRPGRRCW
jgi:hypothetical protein